MNNKQILSISLNKTVVKRLNNNNINNKRKVVKQNLEKKIVANSFYINNLINYVVKHLHRQNATNNLNNIVEETNDEFHLTDDEAFDLYNSNFVPSESNDTANGNDEHTDINHSDNNNDDNVVSDIDIDYATIQNNIDATYVPEIDPDVEAENEELNIIVRDSTKNSKYTREAQRLMGLQKLTPVEIILLLKEISKSMASVVEFPLNKYMDMYRQVYNNNLIVINFNEAGIFIYECSEIFSKEVNYAFDLTANLSITKYDDFILPSVKEARSGKKVKKIANKPIELVNIVAEEKKDDKEVHDVFYINRKSYINQFEFKLPLQNKDNKPIIKTLEKKEYALNEKYIFYTILKKYKRLIKRTSDNHLMFANNLGLMHGDIPSTMIEARIPRLRNRTFKDYFILHATKDPCTEHYTNGLHRANSRKVKFIIYLLTHLMKCKENLLKTIDLGIVNRFNRPLVVDEISYQTFLPTKFILEYLHIDKRYNNAYSKYVSYEKKVHAILQKKNVGDLADKFQNLMLKTIFNNFPNRKKRKKRRSLRIDKSMEVIDLTLVEDDDAFDCFNKTIKEEICDNDILNKLPMDDFLNRNSIYDGMVNEQMSTNFEDNTDKNINRMNLCNNYKDINYDRTRLSFEKQPDVKLCNLTANDQRLLNCRLILPNLLKHIPPDKIDVNNFSINVNRLLNVNSVYNENLFNIDKRLLLTETDFKLPNTYFVKDVPLMLNLLKLPEKLIKHKLIYKLPDEFLINYKLSKITKNSSDRVTRNSNYGLGTLLNKSNILSSTLMGHDDSGNETASFALQEQLNGENNFGDISNVQNGYLSQKSRDSGIQDDDNVSVSSTDSNDYFDDKDCSYKEFSQSYYDEDEERVNHWHKQVAPILEQNKNRNEFDIHAVSREILNKISYVNKIAALEENCESDINNITYKMRPITFSDVIREKGEKNTARYFSSLLQLINFKNVKVNNLNKNTERVTNFDDIEINLLNDVQYFEQNVMFSNPEERNQKTDLLEKKSINNKRKLSQVYDNDEDDGKFLTSNISKKLTSMNQTNNNKNKIQILSNIDASNLKPHKDYSINGSHLSLEAKLCIETSYSIINRCNKYNAFFKNSNRKNKANSQLETSDDSSEMDDDDDDGQEDDDVKTYSLRKSKNAKIIETRLKNSPLAEMNKNKDYDHTTVDSDDAIMDEKSPYKKCYSNRKRKTPVLSSKINSGSDSSSRASNSESDNEFNVKIKHSPKSYYNKKKRNKIDINADNTGNKVPVSTVNRCINFSNCIENVQTNIETIKDKLISNLDNNQNSNDASNNNNNNKKNEETKFNLFKNYKKVEQQQSSAIISSQSQYQYVSSDDDDSNNNFDTNPETQQKILDSYKKNKTINSARTSFYDSAYLSCNSSYSSYSDNSFKDIVTNLNNNNKDMPGPSGLQKKKK